MRQTLILQNGAHVRKVEVDERGIDDKVGNAADTLLENFVGDAQRVHHRRILRNDAGDLIVRDDDERIDILSEVFQPLDSIVHALFAFKVERLGDDGDRQDFQIARNFRDDGSRTRTGAAAHARGDEQKVGILDRLGKYFFAFFRSGSADFRLRAGAETFGQSRTDLNFILRFGEEKDLLVRIDGNVACARDARLDHAVDRVVPCAADADDLYPRNAGQTVQTVKHSKIYPPNPLNNL